MHILKRGVLPHHRFADHFASYAVSFDLLADHLTRDDEDVFIDQSQILCSRMLVGTSKLERKLFEQVIQPHIFSKGQRYIDFMRAEMDSRHAREDDEQRSNIKECRGGLRDIEMLLLMYETKHKVRECLSRSFLHRLAELHPKRAADFHYIHEHLNFIKNLRDLYRLKIAAHNVIGQEYLPPVAESMGYGDDEEAAAQLYDDFMKRTEQAAEVIARLVGGINK
jgi:UTP:GlnB (protein PII) uridylyltransferase